MSRSLGFLLSMIGPEILDSVERCGSTHDGVWSEDYCFMVLLFGDHCSIVLLCMRLLLVKYLLSGGLFGRHTWRQHTRLLFDSFGCLDRQDCVYKYVVARS